MCVQGLLVLGMLFTYSHSSCSTNTLGHLPAVLVVVWLVSQTDKNWNWQYQFLGNRNDRTNVIAIVLAVILSTMQPFLLVLVTAVVECAAGFGFWGFGNGGLRVRKPKTQTAL